MLSDFILGQLWRDAPDEDLPHPFFGRGLLGLDLAVAQAMILLRQHLVHRSGLFEEDESKTLGTTDLVLLDGVFFDGSILAEIFAEFILLGLPLCS